ncbi:hypothetical protein [Xanthobacter autotrophicus]|uniref:hypothetical protein n=1 Tax=Xanthobacter autotrophicus TaxID=280 RepID=UPI0037291880
MDQKQFDALIGAINSPNWAEVATLVALIVSLVAAIISLWYARIQIIADHKRSQRKIAGDLCLKWSEFVAPETVSVVRFIEKLSPQQIDSIVNLGVLEINISLERHLIDMLELKFPNIKDELGSMKVDNLYKIEGRIVQYIRYIAVRYLNMLESILMAWAGGVADRDAIFREFCYVWDETKNRTIMDEFRKKLGVGAFPAIGLFVYEIKRKRDDDLAKSYKDMIIK